MKNIIWLASYPKSGNTWFRVFLTNLMTESNKPAYINNLKKTTIASNRYVFDSLTGIESSDLTFEEIDKIRPFVYKKLSDENESITFMKVHDAYTTINNETTPLFPNDASYGVIYFLRNPLDVAVSYSHHSGRDCDQVIEWMNDMNHSFNGKSKILQNQLRQKLLTWSQHPISWIDNKNIPVCVLRYEDMLKNPIETFTRAVLFTGLKYNLGEIERAINLSSFERLQKQEKEKGFKEKNQHSDSFFRKGKIGSWKEELNEKQVKNIIMNHRQTMIRFKYLNEKNELLF